MGLNRGRSARNDVADSRDNSGSDSAHDAELPSWGDGDLGGGDGERAPDRGARALGLAATQVQMPAPKSEDRLSLAIDDDPIANLFRADQTMRAPSIAPAPSEAELRRWNATMRASSLFDEQVKDPGPAGLQPPPPAGPPAPPREAVRSSAALPGVRNLELDTSLAGPVPPLGELMARAEVAAAAARRAAGVHDMTAQPGQRAGIEVALPDAAGSATARRGKSSGRSGVRSKIEPDAEPARDAAFAREAAATAALSPATEPAPADGAPGRRRRVQGGPKPLTLALLGFAALTTLGSTLALIGVLPNPFADEPRVAVAPIAAAAPAAQPAAVAQPAAAPRAKVQPPVQAPATAAAAEAAPPKAQPAADQAKPAPPAAAAVQPAPAAEPQAMVVQPDAADPSAGTDNQALLAAARKFLADDEPARAEAVARQALAGDAQDHHAMELLVRALMDQDRGQDAVPFARKIVQRRPKRVPYRLLLGDVLLMVGNDAAARAEWQEALKLAPTDRDVKLRLGL